MLRKFGVPLLLPCRGKPTCSTLASTPSSTPNFRSTLPSSTFASHFLGFPACFSVVLQQAAWVKVTLKVHFDSKHVGRPSRLIQHVLTVLVFWSWGAALRPRLPSSSRGLSLYPWTSILLHGPLDICLDLLPAAPLPPVQKRDARHMFLQHRGAHADRNMSKGVPIADRWTKKQASRIHSN